MGCRPVLLPTDDMRTFSWTRMGRYPFPPALCRGVTGTINEGKELWSSLSALCCYCCCSVLSCVLLLATPWTAACQAPLSFTTSWNLLKFMSIELVMLSFHLNLCHPFLFSSSIFSSIRVFSNESALHMRWPKYWSLSFSISPSNEYSGLNSFRIDWFGLLAVQETFKSLLQHHSLKTSILQCSAFFMVQFLHS